jgi:hypothetical protein
LLLSDYTQRKKNIMALQFHNTLRNIYKRKEEIFTRSHNKYSCRLSYTSIPQNNSELLAILRDHMSDIDLHLSTYFKKINFCRMNGKGKAKIVENRTSHSAK